MHHKQLCRNSLFVWKQSLNKQPICSVKWNFIAQVFMMAAGYSSRVLDAIVSLGDDGVVVCLEDHDKFAALIGDYFNETDNDDSGSEEDVECVKYIPPKRCLRSFNTQQRQYTTSPQMTYKN